MCRKCYCFAGVVFAVEGPCEWIPTPAVDIYADEEKSAEVNIRFDFAEVFPLPEGEPLYMDRGISYWRAGQIEEMRCGGVAPYAYVRKTGSELWVLFQPSVLERLSSRIILESIDLCRVMMEFDALVLHASHVLTRQGEALLFSGPCGIGKSTQAALWAANAGAEVVNGDRTLIRLGKPATANGIFFAGTSRINVRHTAPLRAIVLLGQSQENRLQRTGGKEAFLALLAQCTYHPADPESVKQATNILAKLISAVPVYRLDCRPDASAVKLLEEALYAEHAN